MIWWKEGGREGGRDWVHQLKSIIRRSVYACNNVCRLNTHLQHPMDYNLPPQKKRRREGGREGGRPYLVLDIVLDGVLQEVFELEEDLR